MTKVLIISKDQQLSRILNYSLTFSGFTVESAISHDQAVKFIEEIHFQLILMDFVAHKGESVNFCKTLKDNGSRAALVVMGECYDELSILEGMNSAMDDYILKPFGMSELRMIINKQLERKRLTNRPLVLGDLKIDVARSLVFVRDKIVNVGKNELEILIILTKKAGKIVTTDKLITEERMLLLRRKLQKAAGEALQIKSVKGLGYKLIAMESCR
ncbi:MAG: response regulator transcription factor [Bacteriovoracaceae bacterium]|nr:response regulator transcription factor [Bacteriovoracaceae bacterium]